MTEQQSSFLQVFVTFPDRESAARVAQTLVEEALAGCVQIAGPIHSVYQWQGKVESADEWLCLIKTAASRYAQLEQRIRQMHPYQVPEIIAVPISLGSADYLKWLSAALGDASPAP